MPNFMQNRGYIAKLVVIILAVIIISASPAFSQLTKMDIVDMQDRAAEKGWTFTVNENPATSYSLDQLCGLKVPDNLQVEGKYDLSPPDRDLPERFDWRDSSGCTPVRNQAGCGSCWAFGTIGPLECNILIKDGIEVDLSEQWLVSCNSDGWGCSGGWFAHDYHQWKTDPCGGTGAVYESDFPYQASDLPCNCPYPHEFQIDSWSYVGSPYGVPSIDAMKQAIVDYGPISVAVVATSAMQGYSGGIFNAPSIGDVNHAVVLVGWDDNQGTNGVWYMRNSWGQGWGEEDGYMRIEYGVAQIGYGACYVEYTGTNKIAFEYPGGIPEIIQPNQETTFEVMANGIYGGEPVSGSGLLHYSINGQPMQEISMTEISANHYEAVLPPTACLDMLHFYVSVEEAGGEIYNNPDPGSPHMAIAALETVSIYADNFENDQGWTVSGDAQDGQWNRGIPVNYQRGDPPSDYDGSGRCYLTDNVAGNSDVDDGTTILTSPTFDLSMGNGMISYSRWYSNNYGNDPYNDEMLIYISNDDGVSWTLLETVGPVEQASGGWFEAEFWVDDYIVPTDLMKLRFDASDLSDGSVVEAALDAVNITTFICAPPYICGDANADEDVNVSDAVHIANYIFAAGNPPDPMESGDVNCDSEVNVSDAVWIINYIFGGENDPCDIDGDKDTDC